MLNLLKTRRSIRKFQDKKVEDEKIEDILKAALLAPSSRGRRPWEFVTVTDEELLLKLSRCRKQSSHFLSGSPLGIVVIADSELCDVWIEDSSITAIIMQLAAHSLGLDSCWIQIRERMYDEHLKAEDYVKDILNIPKRYSVLCMLAVGYADEKKPEYEISKLPYDKIHRNRF
jgi:nitroreductase